MIPPDLNDEINDVFLEFLQSGSISSGISDHLGPHQQLSNHNDDPLSDSSSEISSQFDQNHEEYKPAVPPNRKISHNIPRYCYKIGQQCFKKMNIQSQLSYFKIDKDRKRSNLSNIMFFLLKAESLGKETLEKFSQWFSKIVCQLCEEKGQSIGIPPSILKIRKQSQFQAIKKYLRLLIQVIERFIIDGDISNSLKCLYQSNRPDKHGKAVEEMKKEQQILKNTAPLISTASSKKHK